ncbi:MAG: diguanylate cyclase, partial [Terracidiphilus sp.]
MLAFTPHTFLFASSDPALLAAVEPVLLASGARVEIVLSAESALASITAPIPPSLALLDVSLPGMESGQLLTAIRANVSSRRLPIVLISDTVTDESIAYLADGVIDDLILRSVEAPYWRLRLELVLRSVQKAREIETLRESALRSAQTDRLTGVYNRETLLAMLFRETDRVQRMKSSLCMILFDIDDFGHWNGRLGADKCDDLLCQVVSRT